MQLALSRTTRQRNITHRPHRVASMRTRPREEEEDDDDDDSPSLCVCAGDRRAQTEVVADGRPNL